MSAPSFEPASSLDEALNVAIDALEILGERDGDCDIYYSWIMVAVLERLMQHSQRRHTVAGNQRAVKAAKRVLDASRDPLREFWRLLERERARENGEKLVNDMLRALWPAAVAS